MPPGLLDSLFTSQAMDSVFSDRAHVQGMLDFDAALARAEAKAGIIPARAAEAIAAKCDAGLVDIDALRRDARDAGNTFLPLHGQLTRLVAADDVAAAGFLHWGATSQDAMDTGLMLQLRRALELIEGDLEKLSEALAVQAGAHRNTVMAGRTWLQQALPVTFGLKVAGWLDAVERHRSRLAGLRPRLVVLQFGGAAGTLASLGDKGLAVAEALAVELGLTLPAMPWHGHRDRLVEAGLAMAALAGSLGKMARDISLLSQTEVAEAFEPTGVGRGGSSAMPQKHNPVACAAILAVALRMPGLAASLLAAMPQEHERGLGGWHAEWTTLPEMFRLAAGALEQAVFLASGLEVDAARMRANLEAAQGQIMAEAIKMALAQRLGQGVAHAIVRRACETATRTDRPLGEVLAGDSEAAAAIPVVELSALLRPESYLGGAEDFVDRVLAGRRGY